MYPGHHLQRGLKERSLYESRELHQLAKTAKSKLFQFRRISRGFKPLFPCRSDFYYDASCEAGASLLGSPDDGLTLGAPRLQGKTGETQR